MEGGIMIKSNEYDEIINKNKEEKYKQMIGIQEKFIRENMKNGEHSVIWIFSDKDYYHNKLERTWYEDFYDKAKKEFEKHGFTIKGIVITW